MVSTRFIRLAAFPAAVLLAVLHVTAAHAIVRFWPNPVNGSASTTTNWNPNGVPSVSDNADFPSTAIGNYTVTWTSPQDTVGFLSVIGGTPSWSITSSLGTQNVFSISSNGRATVAAGRLRSNQLIVGASGFVGPSGFGRLIVSGSGTQVVSRTINAATMFAETVSTSASVTVQNSGQLWSNSWIETARKSATTCSVVVNGALTGPSRFGTLTTSGGGNRGNVYLSNLGTTYMDVSNGGQFECRGDLYVARRGRATLKQIDQTPLLDPFLWVYGSTFIGYEPLASTLAGIGTVSIEGSIARFGGPMFLGDPDHTSGNGDQGTFRVRSGTAILGGSLHMPTSLAGTLELVGGTFQLLSGTNTIVQAVPFNVSSGVATPTLMLNGNSFTTIDPAPGSTVALGIGRGGAGRVRACGNGVHLQCSAATEIADSLGGTGVLEVDSSGIFSTQNTLRIGHGGQLKVSHDAIASVSGSGGGLFQSSGAITVDDALLICDEGDLNASGTFTGSGQIIGAWHNFSSFVIPAGRTLQVTQGGLESYSGSITGGGTLFVAGYLQASGIADVNVDATNADLWPRGDFPTVESSTRPSTGPGLAGIEPLYGHLQIGGDLTLGQTLHVRIGSRASGLRDTLDVSGSATLGGTLVLFSATGAAPGPGDTITVLTAGSVTGTFATVTLDGGSASGTLTVLYGPTSVKVVFAGTTAVGDDPSGARPTALRFAAVHRAGAVAFVLDLPAAARVRLTLYDVSGREVARIADAVVATGRHEFAPKRGTLASGVYFARAEIDAGGRTVVKTARAPLLR